MWAAAALILGWPAAGLAQTGAGGAGSGGRSPFADYRGQQPGVSHKITVQDLPPPHATASVDNGARLIARPKDAWPKAPAGFQVQLYADGLKNPRLIRTAPNGDAFVAESEAGAVRVFRGVTPAGRAARVETFATGLRQPFGIAFYPAGGEPRWVYVANTDAVVRFPYRSGDLQARGPAEVVVPELPGGGRLRGGGHWTRDLAFSRDGKTLFVSVGSRSNADDIDGNPAEFHRADILSFAVGNDGAIAPQSVRVFASGIRNAVGIAIHPKSGELWASVNERDELGDNLVPDYITHIQPGGFYGWPFYYLGANPDPRLRGKHPELASRVIVPDVLLQPHDASLEMVFYDGTQFPAEYRGDIFAAEHGSWNRKVRCGYEVVRVPMHGGTRATGEYEDFLTGFVTPSGDVWGRPVGVAVAPDGALLVTDDGSRSIWRVSVARSR
ncbi:MAG TPA: sorbosone dehydrogenase family protein [Polyangia bacterium]|nr:sorbosone dehydrogenase family protein [Polyangia bacterium]